MKTQQQSHTPTSWHKSAKCQSCGSTTIAYEIHSDKVRAVNSHEALLEAAKEASDVLGHTETMTRKECALCSLQKAIAQAEGRVS